MCHDYIFLQILINYVEGKSILDTGVSYVKHS